MQAGNVYSSFFDYFVLVVVVVVIVVVVVADVGTEYAVPVLGRHLVLAKFFIKCSIRRLDPLFK